MLDLLLLAAQVAPSHDSHVSGDFTLKLVGGIFSGIGVLFAAVWAAYRKGQSSPTTETTIKAPVPVVTVQSATVWARQDELAALRADVEELKGDMDHKLDRLLAGQAEERKTARDALGKVHGRADKNAESLAELRGEVKQMSTNLERLLVLATQPKGRGTNS
ncbi:hypothetical protein OKA04_04640 [Luteolibacter flavescens]|uniref:Chemotaxis protein n=1 Tax=Luteolibacter flavescens TaxID=1859460 RepID=A0ABT3FKA3_9BACT|nr:hypothetical protein [Luteolibacter flavescens]MCW1884004.1 hypothetical protein [Luteolibacter flavescens]